MQLRNYLSVLWRRKWIILVTIIVTMTVVVAGTFQIPPTYRASIMLRVATAAGAATYADFQYSDRLLNTYLKTITSAPVLDELNRQLKLPKSPNIIAEILPNTELIQITVEDRDPNLVYQAANNLGQILIAKSGAFYAGSGKSPAEIIKGELAVALDDLNQARKAYQDLVDSKSSDTVSLSNASALITIKQQIYNSLLTQYQQTLIRETIQANTISIVSPAQNIQSKTNIFTYWGLGFIASLIGGLGLAFVFENLDTTLFTIEKIEETAGLKAFGVIPRSRKKWTDKYFSDAYLQIGIKLLSDHNAKSANRTLLVTSSETKEGKSTVAINLAFAMAELGKKVVIIDCDQRPPVVYKRIRLQNSLGLSDILRGGLEVEKAIQPSIHPGVNVISAGTPQDTPAHLINSTGMKSLITGGLDKYDVVLLDSPAVLEAPDTLVLASMADEVFLVAKRGFVHKENLHATCQQLAEMKANNIELVINN